MRIANINHRLTLLTANGPLDVATASGGEFGSDPQTAYESFDALRHWADTRGEPADPDDWRNVGSRNGWEPEVLGPIAPAPRQIFAIGMNYRAHAAEGGITDLPEQPTVFAKYPSSLSGPVTDIQLPSESVDWEVELVAVISRVADCVDPTQGWDCVAGLTVGQDLSDRQLQFQGPAPQFSLSKSYRGFSPLGSTLVTPDEFPDPDDLEIGCSLNGEQMQKSRTGDLIFRIPELVAYLSTIVTLYPGDVIFTGTPAGVGAGRTPQRYLRPGDELVSWVDGIGELRQRCKPGITAASTERGSAWQHEVLPPVRN